MDDIPKLDEFGAPKCVVTVTLWDVNGVVEVVVRFVAVLPKIMVDDPREPDELGEGVCGFLHC